MTIDAWVRHRAERAPHAPALTFKGETWDYAAFEARIERAARALAAAGVGEGDRVAWFGLNHPDVFTALFACARLRAILVPLNWRLAPAEVAAIVEDCGPKVVLHDAKFAEAAGALAAPGRAVWPHKRLGEDASPHGVEERGDWRGAPLLIVYTSGSTGKPKGAVLSQGAVEACAEMSGAAHELTADDRVLNVLPLFHVGGLNILPTPAFRVGAEVELHEAFDPAAAAAALTRVDTAIMVPTVMQAIMSRPEWAEADLSRLRALSIGSTDVPVEVIAACHERGVPMIQVYGATETSPFAIHQRIAEARETIGSIGGPGSLCDIRLVREDGTEAGVGEPGEIRVKGPSVLTEYWRNPTETAKALQDGWFRTGDVARRDGEGRFWFMDRLKHVVISGGENIYPAELERVLRADPRIAEAAVVGRPDPKWGETPVAVVVPAAELTEEEVFVAFEGRIARYKHPREVVFAKALPRNAMGKVVAADVRAMIGAG